MNIHQIPREDPTIPIENYDHHDACHNELSVESYSEEYRRLARFAIDPETRREYLQLAEMFE